MAGTGERYFVRRKTGDPVGPFSELVIVTMLNRGELDAGAEISRDRINWSSVTSLKPAGAQAGMPAPDAGKPAQDAGTAGWGERDLGEFGDLELGTLDGAVEQPPSPKPEPPPAGQSAAASSMDIMDIDGLQLAPLDLDHSGYQTTPKEAPKDLAQMAPKASGPPPPTLALPKLASLEPGGAPLEPSTESRIGSAHVESARRSLEGSLEGGGGMERSTTTTMAVPAHLADFDESLGSVPITDLGMSPLAQPGAAGPRKAEAGGDGEQAGSGPGLPPGRPGRTMTAAKPRPAPKPKVSRKKLLVAGGAVLLLGAGVAAFFVFELGDVIAGDPDVAKVLGDDTAELARDRFPAYERGAKRLLDVALTRPKSVRLRAAAAELLASSVVLRRGERTRLGKADSIVTDAMAHLKKGAQPPPELARARAWIALGKGKVREAAKVMQEAGAEASAGPQGKLLAAWIELGQGKYPAAEKLFAQGTADHPNHVAFRYGLGRAQEEANKPAAAVTFAQLLKDGGKDGGAHFGAALGLARAGDYAPAARLQLAGKAISEQAKDASRSELADAHALSSRALRLMGKSVEAGAAIEAALAKDSASSTALVAAGELLLDDGRLRDAVAKFKQAVPNAPSLPAAVPTRDIRFAAAAVLIEEGRADDGLALLPPLPAPGDKTDADARAAFWRGRAAELKTPADLEAAARAYESALKSDPRFVPATLQLAALLMRAKRPADAVAALRRAETAGSPAAALQVALGQALVTSGDLERAKKTFRDVLAKSPRYAPARLGLAAVLEAAGNFAGARAELDALYAQSPDTPGLRPRLAEVQVLLGERDKALALFQTEVDAGQASFATRLAAATLALQIGRVPAALALAEKLVVDAPQTPGALLLLGKVRRAGGDTAGALAELRRALSFESTPELHYEYARTLALGGKQEQALTEYEMASVLPAANIERARILIDRSDLERAVPLLEAALKQVPGQADAWLLMGNSYDRLGAQQKAVAAWRAAVKASSDNPEVHYRLGRWEMDQGQPGPALLHLRQAVAEIGKTDKISKTAPAPTGKPAAWIPDCYFQLGFAEKAKGNRPGAVAAFKRYLAVAAADAPSRPEVEQELGRLGSAP